MPTIGSNSPDPVFLHSRREAIMAGGFLVAGIDPIIIGLGAWFIGSYVATVKAAPPPEELVERYFYGGRPLDVGECS